MKRRISFTFQLPIALLCLVCLLPLSALAQDSIEPPPIPSAPLSYINYTPSPSAFQDSLAPIFVHLSAALSATEPEAAKGEFVAALKRSRELLNTLSRGYHDELYFLIGYLQERLSDPRGAILSYATSLRMRTDNVLALFRHAFLLKNKGRCDLAVSEFREAAWRTSLASHEAIFFAAECLLDLGRDEEAYLMAQKAQAINPYFLPVLRRLISTRIKKLQEEPNPSRRAQIESQIMADLAIVATHDPSDRDSAIRFARLLLQKADPLLQGASLQQAEEIAQRFSTASDYTDAEAVRLLFDIQLKRQKLNQAQQTLALGIEKLPHSQSLSQASKQLEIEQGLQASSEEPQQDSSSSTGDD